MNSDHRIPPPHLKRARILRSSQTTDELFLWRALRNRNLKYKFRRQHPIDRFVVDFYCPQSKLCIEVDGGTHYEEGHGDYDSARSEILESLGYKVIRFTNNDVKNNLNAVIDEIIRNIENS